MSKKNIKKKYQFECERYFSFFRAALKDSLKNKTRNGPRACTMSKAVGISTSSISGFIHDNPARRLYPSFQMQVAIAHYLGYEYIDFLAKGRALVVDSSLLDNMALRLKRYSDITESILAKDNAQSTALETVLNSLHRDMEFVDYEQVPGMIDKNSGGGGR